MYSSSVWKTLSRNFSDGTLRTFAIVAVFIPVAFMSGIIGKFFFQFGITVAVAVLVSLFVSFTLDPMLSAVWHDPAGSRFRRAPWLGRFLDRVERHGVADDFRCAALREAAALLGDGRPERARRILEQLSDPTTAPEAVSSGKAALGAWRAPAAPAAPPARRS